MGSYDRLPEGVSRVRATNESPMTLSGTNTYVVGSWIIDPGPDDEDHLDRVVAAVSGQLEGIVITHRHDDHDGGAAKVSERAGGVPILYPGEGDNGGPFEILLTPGHSADSVCLGREDACFTGDTVLGDGSTCISREGGGVSAYLDSLRTLRERNFAVLCPGHGPLVWDPAAKLTDYITHRLDREQRVLAAINSGASSAEEVLALAWESSIRDDPTVYEAAMETLAAHLQKLHTEGRARTTGLLD